jgi:hypothetical protein
MKMTLLLLALLSLPVFAGELPADAAALKGKRDAKITEINQLYANELEKLQKVALKNGSLEAANAIEKEIASVVPNPLKSIIGRWVFRFENNATTEVREFKSDKLHCPGDRVFPWRIEGNLVLIPWGKNDVDKLTIDPSQPNLLEGIDSRGHAISYKRIDKL